MRSCEEIFDPHEHCIDITIDEVKSYLAKIKSILLGLTYKNFCWYQKGVNAGDLLFIFRYDGNFMKLIKGGPKEDTLVIYIKTNKKEKSTLVLSFHPSDNPESLTTLF